MISNTIIRAVDSDGFSIPHVFPALMGKYHVPKEIRYNINNINNNVGNLKSRARGKKQTNLKK